MPGVLQFSDEGLRVYSSKASIKEISLRPYIWVQKSMLWEEKQTYLDGTNIELGEEFVDEDKTYVKIYLPAHPSKFYGERDRIARLLKGHGLTPFNHQISLMKFLYSHCPNLFDYEGCTTLEVDIETKYLFTDMDRVKDNLLLAIGYSINQGPPQKILLPT